MIKSLEARTTLGRLSSAWNQVRVFSSRSLALSGLTACRRPPIAFITIDLYNVDSLILNFYDFLFVKSLLVLLDSQTSYYSYWASKLINSRMIKVLGKKLRLVFSKRIF